MKINLIKLDGKKVGDININDNIFNIEPRVDLMSRVVNWQLSKRRTGSHSVLSRSDISLTKSKAFKQKGTGRARRGANSVVQFRGGGVAHGPVIRSHEHKLNKKIRKLGLKSALSTKMKENNLIIIDKLESDGKTSSLKKHFDKLETVQSQEDYQVERAFHPSIPLNYYYLDLAKHVVPISGLLLPDSNLQGRQISQIPKSPLDASPPPLRSLQTYPVQLKQGLLI